MTKEMMIVEVDGVEEEREIDYPVYRGKDIDGNQKFTYYPKLKHSRGCYEHIDEDDGGVKIYTSIVR